MEELIHNQQIFLMHYANESGNIDIALGKTQLERNHFLSWLSSPPFKLAYEKTRRQVIKLINDETEVLGKMRLVERLRMGYSIETTYEKKTIERLGKQHIQPDGTVVDQPCSEEHTTYKTRKIPVSTADLRLAMQEQSILMAIETLAREGLLSEDQYKRIVSLSSEISDKAADIFSADKKDQKNGADLAVHLIKQAIMGEELEIN